MTIDNQPNKSTSGWGLRDAAMRLCRHAQTPANRDGYVLVRKGDLEALASLAHDRECERAAMAYLREQGKQP